MPDETFYPDWNGIHNSPIWTEQILPWIKQSYQESLEFRSGVGRGPVPAGNGESPLTQQELDWWQGWCAAWKTMMDTPSINVYVENLNRDQEKKDETLRKTADREWRSRQSGF